MADVKNTEVIRGVLDGGRLQFKRGKGKWIDAGGDAQVWITLLTLSDTRDGTYRIAPGSIPSAVRPVEAQRRKATDEEIAEWVRRHDLEGSLKGVDARAAFEDAESLHLTYGVRVADGQTFSKADAHAPGGGDAP